MKMLLLFICLTYSCLGMSYKEQILTPGESFRVKTSHTSAWVKDQQLLQLQKFPGSLLITAQKVGSTLLHIDSTQYLIHVLNPPDQELYFKLKKWAAQKIGPEAGIEQGNVVLLGRLFTFKDWVDLSEYVDSGKNHFLFKARISPHLQKEAQSEFEKMALNSGLASVKVFFNSSPEIRLSKKEALLENYEDLYKKFGVRITLSDQIIPLEPVVKIEMTVIEVQKNSRSKLGLLWPNQATAQIHPQYSWDELNLQLNALSQKGEAKILASPNLLCRSGKESLFFVGGEFPISIRKGHLQDVIWKNYGIQLKFNPLADSSGRMSLGLQSEVSYLDPALKIQDIPALKTQRLSTHFDLTKSQVVVLSGLLKEQSGLSQEGLSFLSDIPILGSLFSSKDYQNDKSELLILVKPSLVNFEAPEAATSPHLQHLSESTL